MYKMLKTKQVCDCGKGYRSAYDGKCGHCRTRKQREHHQYLLRTKDKQQKGKITKSECPE